MTEPPTPPEPPQGPSAPESAARVGGTLLSAFDLQVSRLHLDKPASSVLVEAVRAGAHAVPDGAGQDAGGAVPMAEAIALAVAVCETLEGEAARREERTAQLRRARRRVGRLAEGRATAPGGRALLAELGRRAGSRLGRGARRGGRS